MGVQDNFGSNFFDYRIHIGVPKFERWSLGFRYLDSGGSKMERKKHLQTQNIYMCARVGWKEGWCVCSKMVFGVVWLGRI